MSWYLEVLKKYAVFSGRARRRELWIFILFNIIIIMVLAFIEGMLGLGGESGYGPLSGLYGLAVLIPSLAVEVRRLHDTSRSGWWLLIGLVPFIGAIILIVFFVMDSHPDNEYGPNPKGGGAAAPV